jgi:hypothetical protein
MSDAAAAPAADESWPKADDLLTREEYRGRFPKEGYRDAQDVLVGALSHPPAATSRRLP